jgi:hypothetical protein
MAESEDDERKLKYLWRLRCTAKCFHASQRQKYFRFTDLFLIYLHWMVYLFHSFNVNKTLKYNAIKLNIYHRFVLYNEIVKRNYLQKNILIAEFDKDYSRRFASLSFLVRKKVKQFPLCH